MGAVADWSLANVLVPDRSCGLLEMAIQFAIDEGFLPAVVVVSLIRHANFPTKFNHNIIERKLFWQD